MAKNDTISSRTSLPSADPWAAQLRKGSLELATLASLWTAPRYGLEIIRGLRDSAGIEIAEGTLYPILNRLRADKFLSSEWQDSGVGHPRKYYSLTARGRERTQAMLAVWTEFSRQMTAVLNPLQIEFEGASHV